MKIFNIVLLGLSLTACLKPVYAQQACSCPKDKWCEHKPVWIPKELYNSQYCPITYPDAVLKDISRKHIESRKIKASKAEKLFNFSLTSNHKYKQWIIKGDDYLTDSGNDFYDNELRNKLYMVWRGLEQLPIKHWYDEKGVFLGLRTWLRDAALNNPIILYLYDDDKDPSAAMTSPHFDSNFSEHNTNGNDAWIGLGIYAGCKERQIFFKNPSISNPRLESMKATMAHEMGHVFLVHAWPNLRDANNLPAYVAQEAFAVYTEYLYLKELAAKGHIASFNIMDFIKDTAYRTSGVPSQFTVSEDYILCFLKGLDYSKLILDANGEIVDIPFNHSFLKQASDICGKLKNNQEVTDQEYKYKLIFEPAKHEYFLVLQKKDGTLFTTAQNLSDEAKEQLKQATQPGYLKGKLLQEEKSIMIDYRLAVGKENFLDESIIYMACEPPIGVDFPEHCEPWISMTLDPIKDSEAIQQEKKKKMEAARKQIIQDVLNHLVDYNLKQCGKNGNIVNINMNSPHK